METQRPSVAETIVGRDGELERIAEFLDAAHDSSRALVIEGEPGAGKREARGPLAAKRAGRSV